ncbi:hypothetical protein Zmor_015167 [Zophobas morio]|uniref:Uncharacterized protein n=1 Tax=Zophobas morio TaxID=2755281 RepID=A0AA38IHK3_9CUCU|nr:hypothetical protein Zmor_015167 [Zophobas morio]
MEFSERWPDPSSEFSRVFPLPRDLGIPALVARLPTRTMPFPVQPNVDFPQGDSFCYPPRSPGFAALVDRIQIDSSTQLDSDLQRSRPNRKEHRRLGSLPLKCFPSTAPRRSSR